MSHPIRLHSCIIDQYKDQKKWKLQVLCTRSRELKLYALTPASGGDPTPSVEPGLVKAEHE